MVVLEGGGSGARSPAERPAPLPAGAQPAPGSRSIGSALGLRSRDRGVKLRVIYYSQGYHRDDTMRDPGCEPT